MTVQIKINNIDGVNELVRWASQQPFEIYLSTGADIMINAKSLIGACAMIGKNINMVVADHVSASDFTKALEGLKL